MNTRPPIESQAEAYLRAYQRSPQAKRDAAFRGGAAHPPTIRSNEPEAGQVGYERESPAPSGFGNLGCVVALLGCLLLAYGWLWLFILATTLIARGR